MKSYSFKPKTGGSLQKKEVYNNGENLPTMEKMVKW